MTMTPEELQEARDEKERRRLARYVNTPVWTPEQCPPGMAVHIGEGKFVARCGEEGCGELLEDAYPATVQRHLWYSHQIEAEPLLPRPKKESTP